MSDATTPGPDLLPHPSPSFGARRGRGVIDMVILHYTGMRTGEEALARLCDPAVEVSAHYMVEEDGRIFALVEEAMRAWHAGAGVWQDDRDVNSRSIGIEIVNPGHEWGYRPFPEHQIAAVEALLSGIVSRHAIAPGHVLGHSDVAPARKEDPGELFPWERLARAGFGLWPPADLLLAGDTLRAGDTGEGVERFQSDLAAFGYGLEVTGTFDAATVCVVTAFQRHFEPEAFREDRVGEASPMAQARARWLAERSA